MDYSFQTKNESSKQFVSGIIKYLDGLPCTIKTTDVQRLPEYQKLDVDIVWNRWKTLSIGTKEVDEFVEVKGDFYESGNLFIETISNDTKQNPGCMMITEADWIFYCFFYGYTYILRTKQFREWFLNHCSEFKEVKTKTTGKNDLTLYTSTGILVPETKIPYHKRFLTKEVL